MSPLYSRSNRPIEVAAAPSATNTRVNPRIKVREFTITALIRLAFSAWSSSTEAPEINEIYPGTSGSTHGERNEASPATKAANANGRLCIGRNSTRLDPEDGPFLGYDLDFATDKKATRE